MLAFGAEVVRLDEVLTRIEEKGRSAAKQFEELSRKIDHTLGQLQAWLEEE